MAARPRDGLAVGATWASFAHAPEAGFEHGSEMTVEASYWIVTPAVTLIPDFQRIHHPGGLRKSAGIWCGPARLAVSL